MKKSFVKKLALSKVTVANLNKIEMKAVKGGYISSNCWTGDYCSVQCSDGDECLSKDPNATCGTQTWCYTYACTLLAECEG